MLALFARNFERVMQIWLTDTRASTDGGTFADPKPAADEG